MKRWIARIGIGLSMLLLILLGSVSVGTATAAKPTETPTPTPSPTPMVYQQVATSREATHPDRWIDVFGNEILLDGTECGNIVVSFTVGTDREPESSTQEIVQALGWPDYDPETGGGALNLGRGGEIIIDMNAYLRDSAGMFLYIFTTGKPEDKMTVKLSADLNNWYEIEVKSKDFTGLDKFTNVPSKVKPRYVKIKDRSESGSGVCIDAVVAFDADPVVKVVDGSGGKKTWYEKLNLSKKTATVLCVGVGSFLAVVVVLALVRKINIYRRRRSRRLRLVYSRDRDRDSENGE